MIDYYALPTGMWDKDKLRFYPYRRALYKFWWYWMRQDDERRERVWREWNELAAGERGWTEA